MKRLFRRPRNLRWQLSLSYLLVVWMTIPTVLVVAWAAVVWTSASGLSHSAQLVHSLSAQIERRVAGFFRQKAQLPSSLSTSRHEDLEHVADWHFLSTLEVDHLLGAVTISD